MRRPRTLVILVVLFALAGVSGVALASLTATPASLSRPTWTLFHLVVDGRDQPLSSTRLATVRFIPRDGHVEGTGGCRSFDGSYILLGSQLRMSVSRVSPLFCRGGGVMEQDIQYVQALPRVTSYHIDMSIFTLTLTGDGGRVSLTFGAT